MRNLRLALVLALVVGALLVGTVTLAHAHDTTAPGLYNSHCPLNELAVHTLAPPLEAPATAPLDVAIVPLPVTREAIALDVVTGPAAPRAPPLS